MNATEGGRLRGRFQQRELLGEDQALGAHALDVDGHERTGRDQLLAQFVARFRLGDAIEGAAGAAAPEQAVGAVPGQHLVQELFSLRHLVRDHLRRQQPFEQVVVPETAVASCETDHSGDGVCLEHGAHGVLRHPEPVLRRTSLFLEVA